MTVFKLWNEQEKIKAENTGDRTIQYFLKRKKNHHEQQIISSPIYIFSL